MKTFVLTLVSAKFTVVKYKYCEKVKGYWSTWANWSSCKCKENFESIARQGPRFVRERTRQERFEVLSSNFRVVQDVKFIRKVRNKSKKCFCGSDGITSGCDTWCGVRESFTDEKPCQETLQIEWTNWTICPPVNPWLRQVP